MSALLCAQRDVWGEFLVGLILEELPDAVQSSLNFSLKSREISGDYLGGPRIFRVSNKSILVNDFCYGFLSF